MKEVIEEAIRVVMGIEQHSYRLYRRALLSMPEGEGRQVLEKVAREEAGVIEEMAGRYPLAEPGSLPDDQRPPCTDQQPRESPERRLFGHLRTALLDKHYCLERYAAYLETFRDPAVCQVFRQASAASRRLFTLIAEEYRQADLRISRPGSNRRLKRTHLRGVSRPSPNEHTQLFISLLDSGRRSPI